MCDCIKKTEEKVLIELPLKQRDFQGIELKEAIFLNKAIIFNSKVGLDLTIPMKVSWEHTAKSGRIIQKKKVISFTIQYCPFCGEKRRNNDED